MVANPPLQLSPAQLALVEAPLAQRIFLEGPSGTGKTTAAAARLLSLLRRGVPASQVLVVAPQRTLTTPYQDALDRADLDPGGDVTILTVGGLARRMIDIFWPMVAEAAGFALPDRRPTFLTLETAQYHMARLVRPLVEKEGYFESVTIDRNRLYSQIIDNLNKAAVVGFPHSEIGARLMEAWSGASSQQHIYRHVQECVNCFREYCLKHNLLDFSLQIEVFMRYLMDENRVEGRLCREHLAQTYRHLVADNVEEDTPTTHDLLGAWLPAFESALIVYDTGAGYRHFLGADPDTAYRLKAHCDRVYVFDQSHVAGPDLYALADHLAAGLDRAFPAPVHGDVHAVLDFRYLKPSDDADRMYPRYHPEMLDRVADEVAYLVHEAGCSPGAIVVLAPFLSDALRFALGNRLEARAVPVRSHRPSRALRDEPATLCLLTLAAVAHPAWGICPARHAVAYALMQAIDGMDLVRAQLLAKIVYRVKEGRPALYPFAQLNADMQERITFVLGGRYEGLCDWINAYVQADEPQVLDHFLSRLFGELLSQPGYRFHANIDAGSVAASVIESARKFRWVMEATVAEGAGISEASVPLGYEYLTMVREGVIAAQYVPRWEDAGADAVLLAPAYTFLMRNRPADYQFWLDVGSMGWWERLYQPLTHPYVLRRDWVRGVQWTDAHEDATRKDALLRVVRGLVLRCRRKVYLGLSELDERGSTQQGPLLTAISNMLRRLNVE